MYHKYELHVVMDDGWTTTEKFDNDIDLNREIDALKESFEIDILEYRCRDSFGNYSPWINTFEVMK